MTVNKQVEKLVLKLLILINKQFALFLSEKPNLIVLCLEWSANVDDSQDKGSET